MINTNYLLAKVKRKSTLLKVLSSDEEIFKTPEGLDNSNPYSPATLLEDEEWYKIESFANEPYAIDLIKDDFDSSVDYNQINVTDYPKIAYLCSVQGEKYFFQNMNSNLLLKKNWFSISDAPELIKNQPIIIINQYPDAIYDKQSDILYFKKLQAIKNIFIGIDVLYREATDTETQTFLNNTFLRMTNNFNVSSVKIPNRKRIALVMDTLNRFTTQQKSDIFNYIQTYSNVSFVNDAFEIQTEDDLKHVLYGIEERFYTTQMGNEKRIANSIIALP